MISRRSEFTGFATQEFINSDKVLEILVSMSFGIKKKTVVVLDNASVHGNRKINEIRKMWESRNPYLFLLPSYSSHRKSTIFGQLRQDQSYHLGHGIQRTDRYVLSNVSVMFFD